MPSLNSSQWEKLELEITRVGLKGHGVGVDEENVYFVPRTIPGDRVQIKWKTTTKRYRIAELEKIIIESSQRVPSPCEHFSQCGGCDWLHWDYSYQVKAKEELLKYTLLKAKLDVVHFEPFLPANQALNYRNRIQLHRKDSALGFYQRESHEVVPISNCAVALEKINHTISTLQASLKSRSYQKAEVYLKPSGEVGVEYDKPNATRGFAQVHEKQNLLLKSTLKKWVNEAVCQDVLELYCGDGNLGENLFPEIRSLIGFDSNESAIKAANQRANTNSEYYVVELGKHAALPPASKDIYDTLILDPPRSGTGNIYPKLIHPKLKNIFYISCSPLTFSQDAQHLINAGFRIQKLQGIDMFPHTRHIELMSYFSR